jgi:protein-S-isoprenylcysteine O-methyltransferase Ste14
VVTPPYLQPGSSIAFWLLFGLFALGEAAMRVRSRLNPSGTRADGWSQIIVVVCVVGSILGGLGLASLHATAITAGEWPVFVAGLILMATGIFVRQWAIFALGRFFTGDIRVHAQQTIVDWGPYRWVRHPSYSGMVIFFLGFGMALTNWMSLLLLAVVPTAALVARIRTEEHTLLVGLGEPYRQYAAPRPRLFPGVW